MSAEQNSLETRQAASRTPLLAGAALLVLGMLWIAAEFFDFNLGTLFWPWFVITPGLVLLGWGLAGRVKGLAIAGGVVTMTGLLLFYQALTGHWTSWSYAWALSAPGGVALGMIAYGIVTGTPEDVRSGSRLLLIAAGLFAAGLLFFEVLLGVSGYGLNFWAWPLLLVVAGLALLAYGFVRQRR
jgi:hypothetical protein